MTNPEITGKLPIITLEKPAPFRRLLGQIYNNDIDLQTVRLGAELVYKHLLWRFGREQANILPVKSTNADALPPTAMEPYLLDPARSVEQIVLTLAELGATTLDQIALEHSGSGMAFAHRMMSSLREETPDYPAILAADGILGSLTAQLRCIMPPAARAYRKKALEMINGTGRLAYTVESNGASPLLKVTYSLPNAQPISPDTKAPEWHDLNRRQKFGWEFMALIGKMGDPSLRYAMEFIDERRWYDFYRGKESA